MTEATFPPPPNGDEVDPWAIEHVAPVVVWLGSRAADHVNGNVFVVYGGKVGVMKAPSLDGVFAAEGETWTVDELDKTVGGVPGRRPAARIRGRDRPQALTPTTQRGLCRPHWRGIWATSSDCG